jgi:hypothetical protein
VDEQRTDNPGDPIAGSIALVKWLAIAWGIALLLGAVTLILPDALAAQNSVSLKRAVFTATSTSTLSGFEQSFAHPAAFAWHVQIVFLAQILTGALLSLIGGGVLISRLFGLPHSDRAIAIAGLIVLFLAGIAGVLTIAPNESLLASITRGIGALAGAGTTIAGSGEPTSILRQAIILPLGLAGAAGVVVTLECWQAIIGRSRLSSHALTVLTVMAGVYLLGIVLLTPLVGKFDQANLMLASDIVSSTMGVGATSQSIGQLPRGSDWVIVAMMLVGVGTLSSGGGIGLAWVCTIVASMLPKLLTWIAIELGLVLIALVLILQSEPALSGDRAVMLVVASVRNVGLSHGPVSLTGPGLVILTGLMLVGRLLPLFVIFGWLMGGKRKA